MSSEIKVLQAGTNKENGNLLAIQPKLSGPDYRGQIELSSRLTELMTFAGEAGLITPKTVVVFPENIGLFTYLSDEWPWVHYASTLEQAQIKALIDEKIWLFAYGLQYPDGERMQGILAEMMKRKAARAAAIHNEVFSSISKQYGVTVVAGSIPLPGPQIIDGHLTVDKRAHPFRDMRSVCPVYLPGGILHRQLIVKRHPTGLDMRNQWLRPEPTAPTPVIRTRAGSLAVMIGSDAWHPDSYEGLDNPDMIAVPACIMRGQAWQSRWHGYDSGVEIKPEILAEDAGSISVGQAWKKYALLARGPETGAKAGIATFLRGPLWDQPTSGMPHGFIQEGSFAGNPQHTGSQVISAWL
jgi:hypothetical protein